MFLDFFASEAKMEEGRPDLVVLDIEGTITTLDYVRVELMGWVKARLPAWLQRHPHAACVEKAAQGWNIMPEQVSDRCVQLMESDSKDGLLKLIQAEVMKEGWEKELTAPLFGEVAEALSRWHAKGVKLCIYSSGAEAAQRALVAHVRDRGDLTHLFSGFFDTCVGAKQDSASYRRIAQLAPTHVSAPLFCTDIAAEARAAVQAGWRAALLRRPGNAELPRNEELPALVFDSLDEVGKHFGLD